ncbi:hypothetical protein Tco_0656451 [Tanacetum coccineum]|uniref:Uncharacterized protein n=1 Tax=Tanacetum coccineum TaxID=301880 RepID=A0ABQ4X8S7_9ASTR
MNTTQAQQKALDDAVVSIFYRHQQVLKWQTNWNGQDSSVPCSNPLGCISKHEDNQVYGTILLKDLTNQAMLESKAYKTYYDFASGVKTPKPKYVRKKVDSDTTPKQKSVQATKGTRLKTKAKVAKSDKKKQPAKMPKAKGLDVLSKIALTEAGYPKKQDTISQLSRIWLSKKESWGDSGEEDENDFEDKSDGNDDDEANDDDNQEGDDTNGDDEETDKEDDEEMIDEEEDDEVTKELYDDVNVNLGNEDTDMTNADEDALEQQNVSQESGFEQVEEDVHVTLTPVLDTQKADEH